MAIKPSSIDSKVILVTGGTGSFGRAFVRMLLEKHNPEKVIVFSRDECKQWEMRNSDHIFNSEKIRYFIGDVRDKDRLLMAFRDVDIVVHNQDRDVALIFIHVTYRSQWSIYSSLRIFGSLIVKVAPVGPAFGSVFDATCMSPLCILIIP